MAKLSYIRRCQNGLLTKCQDACEEREDQDIYLDKMRMKVRRQGKNLVVILPEELVHKLALKEGSEVDVEFLDGAAATNGSNSLNDLVTEITDSNLHVETDFGGVRGKEIW